MSVEKERMVKKKKERRIGEWRAFTVSDYLALFRFRPHHTGKGEYHSSCICAFIEERLLEGGQAGRWAGG